MASSGMLRHVALVRTDVSEELSISILILVFLHSVRRLLVTADVPSSPIPVIVTMEARCSSETSVLTRATWRNIPEDGILRIPSYWWCCWCPEILNCTCWAQLNRLRLKGAESILLKCCVLNKRQDDEYFPEW
jgi:hypothetical protein